MYVVGYPECILRVFPCIPNREVKPLVVAISVGVVLHEERVVIGHVFLTKSALQIAALKARIEDWMVEWEGFFIVGFVVEVFEGFKVVIFVMFA